MAFFRDWVFVTQSGLGQIAIDEEVGWYGLSNALTAVGVVGMLSVGDGWEETCDVWALSDMLEGKDNFFVLCHLDSAMTQTTRDPLEILLRSSYVISTSRSANLSTT